MTERRGWDKRHESMANKIELATLALLLETGDETISVAQVAERVGVSPRTFYRYFNSINDALVASPLRSLARISERVRARPDSERLREVFVNAFEGLEVSDSTRLIIRIATKYPQMWRRVIAHMQPTSVDFFEQMVGDRLRRSGQDTSLSRLVAGVLVAVIENQGFSLESRRVFDPLDESLTAVMDLLKS